jgi:hypothetical protein
MFIWVKVVDFLVSLVRINLSHALTLTPIARSLDFSGFIFYLFIVLWNIAHAVILQPLACKEPPCDGVAAQ